MDLEAFNESMKENQPPDGLSEPLQALWWEKKGDWDKAHKIAQDVTGPTGSWIHAYLHRREGDEGNAGYWYSRAGRHKNAESLEAEWKEIVSALLG